MGLCLERKNFNHLVSRLQVIWRPEIRQIVFRSVLLKKYAFKVFYVLAISSFLVIFASLYL